MFGILAGNLEILSLASASAVAPVPSLYPATAIYDSTANTYADTSANNPAVGLVLRWDDKGGKGYSMTQSTSSAAPSISSTGVVFGGGKRLVLSATDRLLTSNASYYAAIFVVAMAANGGSDQRFISHSLPTAANTSRATFGRLNNNSLRLIARAQNNDTQGTLQVQFYPVADRFYVISAICDYANISAQIRVNGTKLVENLNFFASTSTSNGVSLSGSLASEPNSVSSTLLGTFKEIQQYSVPVGSTAPTIDQIAAIEQSLALKYGIS